MRKKCFTIVVFVITLTLLAGCSSNKAPKSEKEIIADIVSNDERFSDYGLEVSGNNILSRLTSTERMTDEVEIQVYSECESFTYESKYKLSYLLYDDGWILDDFQRTYSYWKAIDMVSQQEADEVAILTYGDATFISREDDDNSSIFYYSVNVPEGYILSHRTATIQYNFTLGSVHIR